MVKYIFKENFFLFKNIVLIIWYSKFFLNYYITKKKAVQKSAEFSNIWKKKLKLDLLDQKDWRKIHVSDNLFKNTYYRKLYNFVILKKAIKILIAEKKYDLLDIGSYTNMFLPLFKPFKNIFLSDLSPLANKNKKKIKFFLLNGKDL